MSLERLKTSYVLKKSDFFFIELQLSLYFLPFFIGIIIIIIIIIIVIVIISRRRTPLQS